MKRSDVLMLNRKCGDKDLVTIINFYMESNKKHDLYDGIISLVAELLVLGGTIKEQQSISDDESHAKSTADAYEYFRKFSNDERPKSAKSSSNVSEP